MIPADRIRRRFQAAAPTYAASTPVQQAIADALAGEIIAAGAGQGGRIVEFGCGDGRLTEALIGRLAPRQWLASDFAPAMLAAHRARLSHPALVLAEIDAAAPALQPGFDLVCSSLALQWLPDPAEALTRWRRLVRPGGWLAFSTLLHGAFGQWRSALAAAGAPEPAPAMPALETLTSWLGPHARVRTLDLVQRHDSGLQFLRSARAAGVDAGGGRPLDAGTMRRAIAAFEAGGAEVAYRAALVLERIHGV